MTMYVRVSVCMCVFSKHEHIPVNVKLMCTEQMQISVCVSEQLISNTTTPTNWQPPRKLKVKPQNSILYSSQVTNMKHFVSLGTDESTNRHF